MIETSRFLSPELRAEYHAELMEDYLRQMNGAALMGQVLDSDIIGNHMCRDDSRRAFSWGLRNGRFDFETDGSDDPAVYVTSR